MLKQLVEYWIFLHTCNMQAFYHSGKRWWKAFLQKEPRLENRMQVFYDSGNRWCKSFLSTVQRLENCMSYFKGGPKDLQNVGIMFARWYAYEC